MAQSHHQGHVSTIRGSDPWKKHENAGYMQKIPKKISSLLESVTVIDGAITHDNFDSNACKGL